MKKDYISTSVIRRLPRYYRFLQALEKQGVSRISSRELSVMMGLTASQIRQDLNCFGGFGQQGYGYHVPQLKDEIAVILGLNQTHQAILIGAGNLGRAVAAHMSFEAKGFSLAGIFDKKEAIHGQLVRSLPVRPMETLDEFCHEHKPEVAILCIPADEAETLCRQLVNWGIRGFWNFTNYDIAMHYPELSVVNVHLSDSLMTLSYMLAER